MARQTSAAADLTRSARAASAADASAQERGRVLRNRQRTARTYVQAKHPDTGLAVVFVPGEALPAWVTLRPGDES